MLQIDHLVVVRPTMSETTSLGAAIAAGSAKGVEVWNIENIEAVPNDTFIPCITEDGKCCNSLCSMKKWLI